jgi:hypothetical protein
VSVADVVAGAGWIPSAGGAGPYLAIRARIPSVSRQDVDDAVFGRMEVLELPAVRDTAFLVPRADAGLALAAGRRAYDERLHKLPIDRRVVEALGEKILKTIGSAVFSTDQLRRALPAGSIEDLGDAGKRLGITSTLPAALKLLQVSGRVLRSTEDRRLDGKTQVYRRWPKDIDITPPPDLDRALAQRFLAWAAPATIDDFAWWAGIGKRVAKEAMGPLRLNEARGVLAQIANAPGMEPAGETRIGGNMKPVSRPNGEGASASISKRIQDLGDWRGETLSHVRQLIHEADPDIEEEWKWEKPKSPGIPVWSHDGGICTGESYKEVVKLTFFRGASVKDPKKLFNASLEGGTRRAIDLRTGETINESAFKQLIRDAVAANSAARAQRPGKKK